MDRVKQEPNQNQQRAPDRYGTTARLCPAWQEQDAAPVVPSQGVKLMETTMKKMLLTMTAIIGLAALPTVASADPDAAANAAAGAAVGAGVGFAVGGPVGAAVGAGVGGTVVAGTPQTRDEVVIERREPRVRERSCVRDAAGNSVCEEIRR
jgi:hypothetical protein